MNKSSPTAEAHATRTVVSSKFTLPVGELLAV